jgi:hypothetical protein
MLSAFFNELMALTENEKRIENRKMKEICLESFFILQQQM